MIYFTLLQLKVYARALTVRESWSERDYKYKGYSATRAFEVLIFLYSIYFAVFGLITILLVHVVPEWYGNATVRAERENNGTRFSGHCFSLRPCVTLL